MDVSLIICTRDRSNQLARCLEAVRHITFDRPWELIVVDNGSTDKTASVARELIKTANLRATYLFEPMRGKSRGLNTALESALSSEPIGDILAQNGGRKGPKALAKLDLEVELALHLRRTRVGEDRPRAQSARPELHPPLRPADSFFLDQCLDRMPDYRVVLDDLEDRPGVAEPVRDLRVRIGRPT